MRWRLKAATQGLCALVPRGDRLYQFLQARFGQLEADPRARLPLHASFMERVADVGFEFRGASCLEIGTGHLPTGPICLFLAGAETVTTIDLNRRLNLPLTTNLLDAISRRRDEIRAHFRRLVDDEQFDVRFNLIERYGSDPLKFLESAGIVYRAPCDAAAMTDCDCTFDLIYSTTVLEHVSRSALPFVLEENLRLLRSGGVAAHLVDTSDHFAHQDSAITAINFLRFSEHRWKWIAGNQYGYCNRLRASEFEKRFEQAGYEILRSDKAVDDRATSELAEGFPLDSQFQRFTPEDICTRELQLIARKPPGTAHPRDDE